MTINGYQVTADWSRGGDYTGVLEDLTAASPSYISDEADVVARWGRGDPRATEDATAGVLTFVIRNSGREFSNENPSSPIAGDVIPGTSVRLQVTNPVDFSPDVLFQGPTTAPMNVDTTRKELAVTCSDGWGKPGDTKLSTTVYQGNRTGDLINVILDAIGWPAAARSVDPGVTFVPYWWVEGVDASTAVTDLIHSEGPPAIAYVQNGVFVFRDRHHRVTQTASLTSQGTYTHTIPAGAVPGDYKILTGSFGYDNGLDRIVNSATLEVTPRIPANPAVVWSTDDSIALGANESRVFMIRPDDPFINLQTPSVTGQFVQDQDGTTSYLPDYVLGSGSVSFGLSRTSGQSAFLTITAGGSGCSLPQGLRVRGTPLIAGATRQFTTSDTVSQKKYGNADWDGAAPWAGYYDADAIVDHVVSLYAQHQPSVTFDVDGAVSPATLARILTTQISDRITVRNDENFVNGDYSVEQLTHTIRGLGRRHLLTIGAQVVEPVQAANQFTFDVAGKGFNDGQFALDSANNPATMFRFDVVGKGFNDGAFSV